MLCSVLSFFKLAWLVACFLVGPAVGFLELAQLVGCFVLALAWLLLFSGSASECKVPQFLCILYNLFWKNIRLPFQQKKEGHVGPNNCFVQETDLHTAIFMFG